MAEENPSSSSTKTTICKDLRPVYIASVKDFFERKGIHFSLPQNSANKDFYSDLICNLRKAHTVQKGRVSCLFPVLPLVNIYNGLRGGAVAAIAERVSLACARTAVAEDKQLFLGELIMFYLSAARLNVVLIVEGATVRSRRNLTVVASEFRIKASGKLVYTSRATFYHMPAAKL